MNFCLLFKQLPCFKHVLGILIWAWESTIYGEDEDEIFFYLSLAKKQISENNNRTLEWSQISNREDKVY